MLVNVGEWRELKGVVGKRYIMLIRNHGISLKWDHLVPILILNRHQKSLPAACRTCGIKSSSTRDAKYYNRRTIAEIFAVKYGKRFDDVWSFSSRPTFWCCHFHYRFLWLIFWGYINYVTGDVWPRAFGVSCLTGWFRMQRFMNFTKISLGKRVSKWLCWFNFRKPLSNPKISVAPLCAKEQMMVASGASSANIY